MKTSISFTSGNFDLTVSLEADVSGAAAEAVLQAAGLQVLQRGPIGKAYLRLSGAEKLPSDFKRESVAFSDTAVGVLTDSLTGRFNLNPKGKPEIWMGFALTGCVEHVKGASPDSKFVEERKVASRHAADWPEFISGKIGFKGEAGSYNEPSTESLAAIRAYVKSMTSGI